MKYEVIDNFLDEEYFDSLVKLITYKGSVNTNTQWPWYLTHKITKNHDSDSQNLEKSTAEDQEKRNTKLQSSQRKKHGGGLCAQRTG